MRGLRLSTQPTSQRDEQELNNTIRDVFVYWQAYMEATTLPEQANNLLIVDTMIACLAELHPDYNHDTGQITYPSSS